MEAPTPHISIIPEGISVKAAFTVEKCTNCNHEKCDGHRYHCPLCPPQFFTPVKCTSSIWRHLTTHFASSRSAVTGRGFTVTRCKLECNDDAPHVGHYHCPFCAVTKRAQIRFTKHLAMCQNLPDVRNSKKRAEMLEQMVMDVDVAGPGLEEHQAALSADDTHTSGPSSMIVMRKKLLKHLRRATPVAVACPQCKKKYHPRYLKRHIDIKHQAGPVHHSITRRRHHYATIVDMKRGIYTVSRAIRGPRFPVHVIKRFIDSELYMLCEVSGCMEFLQVQWQTGGSGVPCSHLQSVDYAVPSVECDLETDSLHSLVTCHYLPATSEVAALSLYNEAAAESAPLLREVPEGVGKSRRFKYYSVFDATHSERHVCGRVVATVDNRLNYIICQCKKKGCLHVVIVQWWLYQTLGKLPSARRRKMGATKEVQKILIEISEPNQGDEMKVGEYTVFPYHQYPPSGLNLERMVTYIYEQKATPVVADMASVKQEVTDLSEHLMPAETHCFYCTVELGVPRVISRRATLILRTSKPLERFVTFYKECPKCSTPYRYQESDRGIFNYDDHLLLSYPVISTIRALLINHTDIQTAIQSISYEIGVDLAAYDIENAYLAFEALQAHSFDYFCVLCGHHPVLLVHGLTRKATFDYQDSGQDDIGTIQHETVNVKDFWTRVHKSVFVRGLLKGSSNPFLIQPNLSCWSPYIGPYTRCCDELYNTEYDKATHSDIEEYETMPADLVETILKDESYEGLKRFCRMVSLPVGGSKLEILVSVRSREISRPMFNHAYLSAFSHSGGWLSSACPHNVTYATKFLLHGESSCDYIDILRSLKHIPPVNLADSATSIAKLGCRLIPNLFAPHFGRLVEPTEEHITSAKENRLEVSLPFLNNAGTEKKQPKSVHPVTGVANTYMLFRRCHDEDCPKREDILRKSSLCGEIRAITAQQRVEQFQKDKEKDAQFLSKMNATNHIFIFRLLTHLRNEKMNQILKYKRHITS